MTALTPAKIASELKDVPGWTLRGKAITRTFKLDNFLMSIAFVRRIAKRAEKFQHHPDIDIRFDQVTLTLTTHDAGGLTAKDFSMATECDKIFANFLEP
jgi:4a-hydroxytetrahydrobiopterin dehydratase